MQSYADKNMKEGDRICYVSANMVVCFICCTQILWW